jgi:hypothetical protein
LVAAGVSDKVFKRVDPTKPNVDLLWARLSNLLDRFTESIGVLALLGEADLVLGSAGLFPSSDRRHHGDDEAAQ